MHIDMRLTMESIMLAASAGSMGPMRTWFNAIGAMTVADIVTVERTERYKV